MLYNRCSSGSMNSPDERPRPGRQHKVTMLVFGLVAVVNVVVIVLAGIRG